MKIGVSFKMREGGYDRFGDEKYNKIKTYGFDCVDFDMCNTNHPLYMMNDEDFKLNIKKERELSQKAGIEIFQTHGPWPCPVNSIEEANIAEKMRLIERSIWGTWLLGCKYWVIHPMIPFGIDDMKNGFAEKTWEVNISVMKEFLKIAKKYDVTICVENTPFTEFSLATPQQILKLVHKMDDDNFKMCLDTGHVAVFNNLTLGDSIRQIKDELKVFHIHDNQGETDEHLFPGEGIIDWFDFTSVVKEIGFDGVLSLEVVPKENLETVEFEQQSIKLAEIAHKLATEWKF